MAFTVFFHYLPRLQRILSNQIFPQETPKGVTRWRGSIATQNDIFLRGSFTCIMYDRKKSKQTCCRLGPGLSRPLVPAPKGLEVCKNDLKKPTSVTAFVGFELHV